MDSSVSQNIIFLISHLFFVIFQYIQKSVKKEKKYETPSFKVWGVKPESSDPYLIVQK